MSASRLSGLHSWVLGLALCAALIPADASASTACKFKPSVGQAGKDVREPFGTGFGAAEAHLAPFAPKTSLDLCVWRISAMPLANL